MASPRDIPSVKKLWHQLPYDKFIVKYKLELEAFQDVREFFLNHKEYTHLVICGDDLEVTPEGLEILLNDVRKNGYKTIGGVANLDEGNPDTYAVMLLGCDYSQERPCGNWYKKDTLPKDRIIQVGHLGFTAQVIARELIEKIEWGCIGHFDWFFTKKCKEMNIPILLDTRVKLWHRRREQYDRVKEFKANYPNEGYSFLLKHG